MFDYEIYTDGGYSMQADLGAFSYVILQDGQEIKRFAQKIVHETNNRAEIMAIMESVLSLPNGSSVAVYSDSQYALGVLSGGYKANKNTDLVFRYRKQVKKRGIVVEYNWVRGHSGNEWNEVCDALCNEAAGVDLNYRPMDTHGKITNKFFLSRLSNDELLDLAKRVQEELTKRNI